MPGDSGWEPGTRPWEGLMTPAHLPTEAALASRQWLASVPGPPPKPELSVEPSLTLSSRLPLTPCLLAGPLRLTNLDPPLPHLLLGEGEAWTVSQPSNPFPLPTPAGPLLHTPSTLLPMRGLE